MQLYTCGVKKFGGSAGHPCGAAARALDRAGLEYELKVAPGFKNVPFGLRGGKRDEIERLSGQRSVPILVLEDGDVVVGSGAIVEWAREHGAG